jgi:hypothetical protein
VLALEKKALRDNEQTYLRELAQEKRKSERLLLNILLYLIGHNVSKKGKFTIADEVLLKQQ